MPIGEHLYLLVIEQVPGLLPRAFLRLYTHECKVMIARIKYETLELVDYHVCLWVIEAAQLEDAWDEKERW